MRYKVYDTVNRQDITDDPTLILKPDGRLALNDYGDEIVPSDKPWLRQRTTVLLPIKMEKV